MEGHTICGIVVDRGLLSDEERSAALERIAHRGPDGQVSTQCGPTWLGHDRLSIVDVAGGAQPLADADGAVWLACNGEIYNHEALRDRLGREHFTTDSDNEAALQAVLAWGTNGVAELRGMFAFCIAWPDGRLVAARDPLGIKPLYWVRDGADVAFASELIAFPGRLRAHVVPFPPGHWWDGGEPQPFLDLGESGPPLDSKDEARKALRSTLSAAIERRLMADVGVGVFLSGGLDSSIVAAVAAPLARAQGQVLRSYAVGTEGSPDLLAARVVADHLGLDHAERTYTADEAQSVLGDVVRAIESFEPSLVRSAVPNWFLAELAARDVKVVLTGEGADELFAGYDYLRGVADHGALRDELLRSVRGLHNLNLQRCDRVTMAHGLEARVPFLDLGLVALAQRIPVEWKLPGEHGQEKRLLREAFEGTLPDEILWRRKQQFGDGSGATDALAEAAAREADKAANKEANKKADGHDDQDLPGMPPARSDEERRYQELFAAHLGGVDVERVLGRFATA